jgi:hypothetical protein
VYNASYFVHSENKGCAMSFSPITDYAKITRSMNALRQVLYNAPNLHEKVLSYRRNAGEEVKEHSVQWHGEHHYWAFLSQSPNNEDKYWNAFGYWVHTSAPERRNLPITCEINLHKRGFKGTDLREQPSGLLLTVSGKVFLAHSGDIGGGKQGTSREEFLSLCDLEHTSILMPCGVEREYIVIGDIKSPDFLSQVSSFVEQVDEYKQSIKQKKGYADKVIPQNTVKLFHREKLTSKYEYEPRKKVMAERKHDMIVNEVNARFLGGSGYEDKRRDLLDKKERPTVVFEIKLSSSYYDIYTGIGQLMYYGELTKPTPRRVLVLPNDSPSLRSILSNIGIDLLRYEVGKRGVIFKDYRRLQRSLEKLVSQ